MTIIGNVLVHLLIDLIKPYMGLVVIIITLTLCGNYIYQRNRNW